MISHERLDRLAGQVLPPRPARSLADFANARTAADYDTVVCTTGFAREEFDRIGATNVVTVPLGVDLQTFHPRHHSPLVRQQWATPTQLLLVHCGRLSVEKRVDRSIDAAEQINGSWNASAEAFAKIIEPLLQTTDQLYTECSGASSTLMGLIMSGVAELLKSGIGDFFCNEYSGHWQPFS